MTERKRPSLATAICYRDPKAALQWLEEAFGFEPTMVVINPDGSLGHSEMCFGDGMIMVGGEYDERHKSPASIQGLNTQSIHVQLDDGIDQHCERARRAGAVIVRELADQFYGDRVYAALDPDGHVWSFGQTIRAMSKEEMAKRGGVKVRERL